MRTCLKCNGRGYLSTLQPKYKVGDRVRYILSDMDNEYMIDSVIPDDGDPTGYSYKLTGAGIIYVGGSNLDLSLSP